VGRISSSSQTNRRPAASDQDLAPGHVVVSAAVVVGYALTRD
jgi:hypothetical protein